MFIDEASKWTDKKNADFKVNFKTFKNTPRLRMRHADICIYGIINVGYLFHLNVVTTVRVL